MDFNNNDSQNNQNDGFDSNNQNQNQYDLRDTFQGNFYQYGTDEMPKSGKGLSIASLVCGIISVVCCCFSGFYVPGVCAVAAIVCAIISRTKKKEFDGMSIAGLILGILGIIITVTVIASSLWFVNNLSNPEFVDWLAQNGVDVSTLEELYA